MVDLRGASKGPQPVGILEDPTGKRRVLMRRIARSIACVFALWLAALLFGGLGLFPVAGLPLGGVLKPPTEPPPLAARDVRPRAPVSIDRRGVTRAVPAELRGGSRSLQADRGQARVGVPRSRSGTRGISRPSTVAPSSTPTSPAAGAPSAPEPGGSSKGPAVAPPSRPAGPTPRPTTPPGQDPAASSPGSSGSAPGQTGTAPGSSHRPLRP